MKKFLTGLCMLSMSIISTAKNTIPLTDFVQLPDVENVVISPSGNKMAMLKRVLSNGERVFVVEITDLNTAKKTYPVVRRKHEFDVYQLIWASDNHILLKIDLFKQLKIENTGYNPKISERRLMVLNLKDNSLKNILGGKAMNRFQKKGWQPQFQDEIIDLLPNDPDHILHAVDWNLRLAPQVFKVNLNTLDRETVLTGRKYWENILTDRQSNVRVGVYKEIESGGLVDTKVTYEVNVKNLDTGKWSVLTKFEEGSSDRMWPIGFLADPNMLLVLADYEGNNAIFKIDLTKPNEKSLYYSRKNGNVGSRLFYSNKTNNPVGYYTTRGIHFWDESYEAVSQGIDLALPNTNNYLQAFTDDENKYLIYASSDIDSGSYYLGNRNEKTLNPVAFTYSSLDPAKLVSTEKHNISTRDGYKANVFITRPKQNTDSVSPTIIYANHGRGKASYGGFDYKTQLWANRGYTVIQVNFRNGSGSFYNFMRKDVSQWAPKLYNDIADVSEWAIHKGYADKTKMCVFGQGYTGYIALMSSIKSPDMFKCVVAFGAMTDINNHLFNKKGFVQYEQMIERLSDKSSVQNAFSPISYAKSVTSSTMLAHGEDDSMIRSVQSERLYEALVNYNKEAKFIKIENEDSSFTTDKSRKKVFEAVQVFLDRNLQ